MSEEKLEMEKCSSLRYFAENYLRIKDEHGNDIKLQRHQLDLLDAIGKAQEQGGELKRVWMRGRYRWVIIKP